MTDLVTALFWVGLALLLAGAVSMVLFRRDDDNETKESR